MQGQLLELTIGIAENIRSTVVWTADGLAGVRFEQALDLKPLTRAVQRAPLPHPLQAGPLRSGTRRPLTDMSSIRRQPPDQNYPRIGVRATLAA